MDHFLQPLLVALLQHRQEAVGVLHPLLMTTLAWLSSASASVHLIRIITTPWFYTFCVSTMASTCNTVYVIISLTRRDNLTCSVSLSPMFSLFDCTGASLEPGTSCEFVSLCNKGRS
jgi:hypothetical protein